MNKDGVVSKQEFLDGFNQNQQARQQLLRAGIERQGDAQEAASMLVTNVPEDVLTGMQLSLLLSLCCYSN